MKGLFLPNISQKKTDNYDKFIRKYQQLDISYPDFHNNSSYADR